MEGEGGRFRRTHCVPMPVVDSIDELNELLEAADDKDDHRRIGNRPETVGHDWANWNAQLLRPLPSEPFPTWLDVDTAGRPVCPVTVRASPVLGAGEVHRQHRCGSSLGASTVTVFDKRHQVARP